MIEVGDIWRRCGPLEWVKVMRVVLPGYTDYDGGLPGVSVIFTNEKGKWGRKRWFLPYSNEQNFILGMEKMFRWKIPKNSPVENFSIDLLPENLRLLR